MYEPSMSTNASNVINCMTLGNECEWSSPASNDRSDPKSNMVCPSTKPIRIWKDKSDPNEKRVFRCTSSGTKTSDQTESCHISMLAPENTNTTNWKENKTITFNESCINTWYKY